MRISRRGLAWGAAAAGLAATAWGDAAATPVEAARAAAAASAEAAVDVAEGGRPSAVTRLDAVKATVSAAATTTNAARRALDRVMRRLDTAAVLAGCAQDCAGDESLVRSLRRAARAAHGAVRRLRTGADGLDVLERGGGGGFHRPAARVTLRVAGCDEAPVATIANASPGSWHRTFEAGVETLGPGAFRVTLGPDVGGARVTVTACGVTREFVLFNEGPRRVFQGLAPAPPQFPNSGIFLRSGVAATPVTPAPGAGVDEYDVSPPLPAGLVLDAATGTISGTPSAASPTASHFVIARNRLYGAAASLVALQVTPPLPPEVVALEDGFAIEPVLLAANVPVKMAFAPDGRLFFNELVTGSVRILRPDGTLVAAPFATVPILTGGENGLLGIAIAPDFATSGHVFVYACTPADAVLPDRGRIVRFTAAGDAGTQATVVVDSLPVGGAQNGGEVCFGPDGRLYVTVGDTTNAELAQTDGARAGRILRFEPDGTVPSGNPIPGDPEWCRGLRNSFDLAFHPAAGGLFASENGPTAHDELDFIQPGKNYEWGAEPESIPGPSIGYLMIDWTPVIVPTGITFLARGGFGPAYASSLFVAGYDHADLRRVVLSGSQFTDVEEERSFARFRDEGIGNKPLDLAEAPDGSLYVSTFTAIWRISRY